MREVKVAQRRDRSIEHPLENFYRAGALQIDLGRDVGYVFDGNVGAARVPLLLDPRHVFRTRPGVHDQHERLIVEPVHDEIVEHAAVLPAHHPIAASPRGQRGDGTRQKTIEERFRLRSGGPDFPHVTGVEYHRPRSRRFVFRQDAFVSDRHLITAELGHGGAQSDMLGIEGCALQFCFAPHRSCRARPYRSGDRRTKWLYGSVTGRARNPPARLRGAGRPIPSVRLRSIRRLPSKTYANSAGFAILRRSGIGSCRRQTDAGGDRISTQPQAVGRCSYAKNSGAAV